MIIERIRMSFFSGAKQKLARTLVSLTGPTGALPGCLSCRVLQGFQDGNELQLEMEWASKEDLVHHLRSDTYKQLLLLMELGPKPPVVQFFAVQEIHGLDLVEVARSSSN